MKPSTDGDVEALPSVYDQASEVYHELHPREIRLVKLLKGQWSDKIICQLFHSALSNRPRYKALSYAWGSPKVTRPIQVNGCFHSVTVNLESALRRLRRIDSDLTLWIDAICINQSNNSERTEQVNLMHDIFNSTQEVVVYLGEPQNHSSTTLNEPVSTLNTTFHYDDSDKEKLDSFCSRTPSTMSKNEGRIDFVYEIFCFLRLLAGNSDSLHIPAFNLNSRQFTDTKYQRSLFEELRQLMLSRWWNRIWVVQEVVVPENVIMVYGSLVAPWNMFADAARWESLNRSSINPLSFPHEYSTVLSYFSRIILDIDRMRQLWRFGNQTTLLPLLRRFSGRKASDDRDKVYALLSMARTSTAIIPDYSLSVPEVFQATVFDIIKTTKSLAVFAGDLGRKDRQDLPSWVPDWSAVFDNVDRRRADNMAKYKTTEGSVIYVQNEETPKLGGIRHYLKTESKILEKDYGAGDPVERFNRDLGTSDWMEWLPDDYRNRTVGTSRWEKCEVAISNFYTDRGGPVCLQKYGGGVIGLSGLLIDRVVATGDMTYSEDGLVSVAQSWAKLAYNTSRNKEYHHSGGGLGHAFRIMLCADTVRSGSESEGFVTRRVCEEDHYLIANWLRRQNEISREYIWESYSGELISDMEDYSSVESPEPISPEIDTAIRSATMRRTFFITDKFYIGLGPTKTRVGDSLCILLGGQTPFILRNAGSRNILRVPSRPRLGKVRRSCFEVIGDCYSHGLMDGEAMDLWRAQTSERRKEGTLLRDRLDMWENAYKNRERQVTDVDEWRSRKFYLESFHQCVEMETIDSDEIESADWEAIERDLEKFWEGGLVQHSHLLTEFYTGQREPIWMRNRAVIVELLKRAERKLTSFTECIKIQEKKMDKIRAEIQDKDQHLDQRGYLYLV